MQFYDEDGFRFNQYYEHLKSIKDKLPEHVYEYAIVSEHYDLSSPHTLHDSWLEYINIKEKSSGERHEIRHSQVEIKLLGAFHDKFIFLHYDHVLAFKTDDPQNLEKGYGDLLFHEFHYCDEKDCVIHEISFERGNIQTYFKEFKVKYEDI